MRMQAAVMFEQGLPTPFADSEPFVIEDVDLAGPGEGEVLVEVRAAGLCHSDLSTVEGARKRALPVVGGHEGAGIVREVGPNVHRLKPGDHVVMTVAAGCGECRPCIDGRPALCDVVGVARSQGLLAGGGTRLSLGGRPVYHYSGISSFAQYAVTAENSLIAIDRSIPLEVAALFGCAVVTGVGAVLNCAKVRPGQAVAVIGLGGVGLNAVMGARLAGASRIIGIDLNPEKFPLAHELGCTDTFAATEPEIVARIRELTRGGVDFAFEISGNRRAAETAFAITRKGGEVICIGLGAAGEHAPCPQTELVAQEKALRGSLMGSGVPARDIPQFADFFMDGRLPVDRLKSGTMGFAELNRNLDRLSEGAVLRQVLLPHG